MQNIYVPCKDSEAESEDKLAASAIVVPTRPPGVPTRLRGGRIPLPTSSPEII